MGVGTILPHPLDQQRHEEEKRDEKGGREGDEGGEKTLTTRSGGARVSFCSDDRIEVTPPPVP